MFQDPLISSHISDMWIFIETCLIYQPLFYSFECLYNWQCHFFEFLPIHFYHYILLLFHLYVELLFQFHFDSQHQNYLYAFYMRTLMCFDLHVWIDIMINCIAHHIYMLWSHCVWTCTPMFHKDSLLNYYNNDKILLLY